MTKKNGALVRMKSGTTLATKNFLIPTIDALVLFDSKWFVPWLILKGFFGIIFDYQQDRLNEFTSFLKENNEKFPRKTLETEEFQNAFVITFEAYFKQRNEEKRKLIQKIFLGYASDDDKAKFQLERLYRIIELISLESVEYLGFISKNVWLSLMDDIESGEAIKQNLSEILGKFFSDRVNQIDFGSYFNDGQEYLSELTTLGIIRNKGTKSITYAGEGNAILGFTKFGVLVIRFFLEFEINS